MRLAVAVWIAAAPLLLEGAEGSALAQGPWNLDELRKRLVRSVLFIVIAFVGCFFASPYIYNFLAIPIKRALNEAAVRDMAAAGQDQGSIGSLVDLKAGDRGRYVFNRATSFGPVAVQPGASVEVVAAADGDSEKEIADGDFGGNHGEAVPKVTIPPILMSIVSRPSGVHACRHLDLLSWRFAGPPSREPTSGARCHALLRPEHRSQTE